jgi:hypothetical protein
VRACSNGREIRGSRARVFEWSRDYRAALSRSGFVSARAAHVHRRVNDRVDNQQWLFSAHHCDYEHKIWGSARVHSGQHRRPAREQA